ncbi:fimbrial protein [Serratia fonticola]|uniref:fimbrial protein n=1 Tax=Serratia fonticola TaxID=47917 RepID=UPI001C4370FF|nr:fimbrial protein [Serratia fonticola]QXN64745.1 fimbrial protein [Serratia fonticola]
MSFFSKGERLFIKCVILFLAIGGLLLQRINAADVAIKVRGSIMLPPCVINENNSVELDFGTVYIRDVMAGTSDSIKKTVVLPVRCLDINGLKVKFSNNAGSVSGHKLETIGIPKSGLAIAFYDMNRNAFNLNAYADFSRFGSLKCSGANCLGTLGFNMVLERYNNNIALTPADFSASTTLVLEWQ